LWVLCVSKTINVGLVWLAQVASHGHVPWPMAASCWWSKHCWGVVHAVNSGLAALNSELAVLNSGQAVLNNGLALVNGGLALPNAGLAVLVWIASNCVHGQQELSAGQHQWNVPYSTAAPQGVLVVSNKAAADCACRDSSTWS
jgi:hypothetical protein